MDYLIDPAIQQLLDPLTKEEFDTLEEMILEDGHADPGVVGIVGTVRTLADGHNRRIICLKHGLDFQVREKKFKDRDAMLKWIIRNQTGRRNLTAERRQHFVGVLSAMGQSTRTIADTLGVGKSTVQRDLEESGVPFGTPVESTAEKPANEPKKVIGKDGKTYPQTPILCRACQHRKEVGKPLIDGCEDCAKLRGKKAPKEAPKPKAGKPIAYRMNDFDTPFGSLMRQVDILGNLYRCKESSKANKLRDQLAAFRKLFMEWHKEIAR